MCLFVDVLATIESASCWMMMENTERMMMGEKTLRERMAALEALLGRKGMYDTVFLFLFVCAPVDGVEYFLGGKGMFLCFYVYRSHA